MEKEIWKSVVGYEGLYEVSNMGNLRNVNRGKMLKLVKNSSGYLYVTLSKNGIIKSFRVHRLVAEAFIPNPDNLPIINHKNEIKTDNRLENLEFCSYKYNSAYSLGNHILQFTKSGEFVAEYESAREASRQTGTDHKSILCCCKCKPRYKSAGGFIWRYKE